MSRIVIKEIVGFPTYTPIYGQCHCQLIATTADRRSVVFKYTNDGSAYLLAGLEAIPIVKFNPERLFRSIIQSTKHRIKWPRKLEYQNIVPIEDDNCRWEDFDEPTDRARARAYDLYDNDYDETDDDET